MLNKENISITKTTNKSSRLDVFRSQMKTKLIIACAKPILSAENNESKDSISFCQKYEEMEKIGEGSHSVVKKCKIKQGIDKRFYTAKIIRTDDFEIVEQARREFEIVKKLSHENILKVEELFINEKRGIIHLVSSYYPESITLQKFLDSQPNRQILEREAILILKQLFYAVQYLHSEGIVHRDLKPSNILIQPDTLKIVLIDFGISKIWSKETTMCTPTGTPLYKAPEVIRVEQYDEKVDIWSIGVILFEMLIGQKPFSFSQNEEEMIEKMETQSFCTSSRFRKQNINAQDILKQLLEPDCESRISSSEALQHPFIQGLNSVLQQVSRLNVEFTPPKLIINSNKTVNIPNNLEISQASYKKIEKRLTFSSEKQQFIDENCYDSKANVYLSPPLKLNRSQFICSQNLLYNSLTPKNNISHPFNQFQ